MTAGSELWIRMETMHSTFEAGDFSRHLVERVEPWTYMKTLALKDPGRSRFSADAPDGIYRVGPLARLNVASGISTPLAHAEYEKMMHYFGKKPVHHTMAYHWARLIEVLYAAERTAELAREPNMLHAEVRNLPKPLLTERSGTGACEAPRGTLFHAYQADAQAMILKLNLVVATQHNAAAICRSVFQAASQLISGRTGFRADQRTGSKWRTGPTTPAWRAQHTEYGTKRYHFHDSHAIIDRNIFEFRYLATGSER